MTDFGRLALIRLANLGSLAFFVPGDNNAFNERLHEKHEKRKADALAGLRAMLGPDDMDVQISYTGEDGSVLNGPYSEVLDRFIGETVVCSCVDTYHWYLRRVFEASLHADRSRIHDWAETLGISQKKITDIATATDLGCAISSVFRGREAVFRSLAHDFLNVPDLGLIPKAVLLRNCLVHELGHDRTGAVAEAIETENDLEIAIDRGVVTVPVGAAYSIAGRFFSDVSIMDQCLANILNLPSDNTPITPISRAYS